MKALVQGAYTNDWVHMNDARAEEFDVRRNYIKPTPNKAALGHSAGAQKLLGSQKEDGPGWKISKFTKVESKVAQLVNGPKPDVETIHQGS